MNLILHTSDILIEILLHIYKPSKLFRLFTIRLKHFGVKVSTKFLSKYICEKIDHRINDFCFHRFKKDDKKVLPLSWFLRILSQINHITKDSFFQNLVVFVQMYDQRSFKFQNSISKFSAQKYFSNQSNVD